MRTEKMRATLYAVVLLSILYILPAATPCQAVEPIRIPFGASDSYVCSIIEREYHQGLDLWKAGHLLVALDRFQACESTLKGKYLWAPPKLPARATADQYRAWNITNAVVYSLTSAYQHLDRQTEFEKYAVQARERGLLPKVVMPPHKTR